MKRQETHPGVTAIEVQFTPVVKKTRKPSRRQRHETRRNVTSKVVVMVTVRSVSHAHLFSLNILRKHSLERRSDSLLQLESYKNPGAPLELLSAIRWEYFGAVALHGAGMVSHMFKVWRFLQGHRTGALSAPSSH